MLIGPFSKFFFRTADKPIQLLTRRRRMSSEQVNEVLDTVTGEKVSKSEFKRRQKARAKAEEKAQKDAGKVCFTDIKD